MKRIVTVASLALVFPILLGCASGSAIITGTTRTPLNPDQVTVYLEPPSDFKVIGLVQASSDMGWTEQGSQDYAIAELKQQAAKLGANGVLLMAAGEKTTGVVGYNNGFLYAVPHTAKTVQGKAIFIDKR